jgi:hypothetical protein
VLKCHNDSGRHEMMSMMHRMDKVLQENLSATRNASRIGFEDWDRVLNSLHIRVVPALNDPDQDILKRTEAVAFW